MHALSAHFVNCLERERLAEEFGEARLVQALRQHKSLATPDLISAIVDEVQRFSPNEQHDDITLIVAKCRPDKSADQMGLPYDWSA